MIICLYLLKQPTYLLMNPSSYTTAPSKNSKFSVSRGNYGFCSNSKQPIKNVFNLNSGKSNLVKFTTEITRELSNIISAVVIKNAEGFAVNYTRDHVTNHPLNIIMTFSDDHFELGSQLTIQYITIYHYQKYIPLPDGRYYKRMMRSENIIYEEKLTVPKLPVECDTPCTICLDKIDEKDKLTTFCGHIFHTMCMYQYAETINLVSESDCSFACKHSDIISPYPCPNCRELQITA